SPNDVSSLVLDMGNTNVALVMRASSQMKVASQLVDFRVTRSLLVDVSDQSPGIQHVKDYVYALNLLLGTPSKSTDLITPLGLEVTMNQSLERRTIALNLNELHSIVSYRDLAALIDTYK